MKISPSGAGRCGRWPLPETRGHLQHLFQSTIAPELRKANLRVCHGLVREWLMANCQIDEGAAEILTCALHHVIEAVR